MLKVPDLAKIQEQSQKDELLKNLNVYFLMKHMQDLRKLVEQKNKIIVVQDSMITAQNSMMEMMKLPKKRQVESILIEKRVEKKIKIKYEDENIENIDDIDFSTIFDNC